MSAAIIADNRRIKVWLHQDLIMNHRMYLINTITANFWKIYAGKGKVIPYQPADAREKLQHFFVNGYCLIETRFRLQSVAVISVNNNRHAATWEFWYTVWTFLVFWAVNCLILEKTWRHCQIVHFAPLLLWRLKGQKAFGKNLTS